MHEIVSFSKDIEFKNMINKITSISLEHTLMLEDKSNIKGDFIVSGSYKMTAASQIENDFSYKIPVDIEVDDKYDLSNLVIDIDDFTYEVIDEEILRVNIDLLLDKLEVKEKLGQLKDALVQEFHLSDLPSVRWERKRDAFISSIAKLKDQSIKISDEALKLLQAASNAKDGVILKTTDF